MITRCPCYLYNALVLYWLIVRHSSRIKRIVLPQVRIFLRGAPSLIHWGSFFMSIVSICQLPAWSLDVWGDAYSKVFVLAILLLNCLIVTLWACSEDLPVNSITFLGGIISSDFKVCHWRLVFGRYVRCTLVHFLFGREILVSRIKKCGILQSDFTFVHDAIVWQENRMRDAACCLIYKRIGAAYLFRSNVIVVCPRTSTIWSCANSVRCLGAFLADSSPIGRGYNLKVWNCMSSSSNSSALRWL